MLSKKVVYEPIEDFFSDKYLYFDIETTGFSAKYNSVRMITYMYYKQNNRYVETHFAESKIDESLLLAEFIAISKKYISLIHFNGNTFDIPFLNHRMSIYNFNYEVDKSNTIDVYKLIKNKYKLKSYKLKDLESHFGIDREDEIDGSVWLKKLKEYENGNKKLLSELILHNYEDVLNLESLINKSDIRDEIESRIVTYEDSPYFIKNIKMAQKHTRIILFNHLNKMKIDIPTIKHNSITLLFNSKFDDETNDGKKKYIIAIDDNIIYENIDFIIRVGGGTQI